MSLTARCCVSSTRLNLWLSISARFFIALMIPLISSRIFTCSSISRRLLMRDDLLDPSCNCPPPLFFTVIEREPRSRHFGGETIHDGWDLILGKLVEPTQIVGSQPG